MSFKLFPYLEWYNIKKLSDSYEKKLYDEKLTLFSEHGFLAKYNDVSTSFDLIKTVIIIEAILNKRQIESEAEVFTDIELNEESRNRVIHSRLPYFEDDGVKIYVPFFTREFNVHYDTKLDSLTRYPFVSLKDDFESSVINPFDHYGYKLFDSNFTRLIKIREYAKQGAAVFYHIDFETIYVINDQGSCDAEIPIFDSDVKEPNKDKLFERIDSLMEHYFNNERVLFIDALLDLGLISDHLYNEIKKNSIRKIIKRKRMSRRGKDLNA